MCEGRGSFLSLPVETETKIPCTDDSVLKSVVKLKRVIPPTVQIKVCVQVSGSTTAYMEKSSIKPFVAPDEAACNLIKSLQ